MYSAVETPEVEAEEPAVEMEAAVEAMYVPPGRWGVEEWVALVAAALHHRAGFAAAERQ